MCSRTAAGAATTSRSSASSIGPSSSRRPAAPTGARSSSTESGSREEQLAALSLEAVGIASKALELAVEYAKTREQFGRPIGVYQAVSHRLADTYVESELARSLAYWAAWCVAEGDEQAAVAVAAAKSYCGDAAVVGLRALDPDPRRDRLHLGARAAPSTTSVRSWIQAYGGYAREQRAAIAAWLLD